MASRKHKHHDAQDDGEYVVRNRYGPRSLERNVTPLIDVLLVLLIIFFMATLPLTQRGEDVTLPLETQAAVKPQDGRAVKSARRFLQRM